MLPQSLFKGKGNESADQMMGGDYLTQNGFERNDTSMKGI
jgi:hypothetical protein